MRKDSKRVEQLRQALTEIACITFVDLPEGSLGYTAVGALGQLAAKALDEDNQSVGSPPEPWDIMPVIAIKFQACEAHGGAVCLCGCEASKN
jgi:hypothetical protein